MRASERVAAVFQQQDSAACAQFSQPRDGKRIGQRMSHEDGARSRTYRLCNRFERGHVGSKLDIHKDRKKEVLNDGCHRGGEPCSGRNDLVSWLETALSE